MLVILIDTSIYVIAADELLSDDKVMILEYVDCTSVSRAYNVWVHMVEDIKMRTFECDYFGGRRNIMSRTFLNILMTEKRFSAIDTMLGLFLENKECKIS